MSRPRLLDLFSSRTRARRRNSRREKAQQRVRRPFFEQLEGRALLAADLVVTKVDTADPVAPGGDITYNISVTNNGPDNAAGLTLLDIVPTNTTFVSFTAPAGWTASTPAVGGTGAISASAAALNNAATASFTLVVRINAGTALDTSISNTAIVASGTPDDIPENNSDTETTLVQVSAAADLEVVVTDSPDPVVAGTNVTYSVTVRNIGSADAQNVTITSVVPTGTTFVSAAQNTGTAFTLTTPAVGSGGTISGFTATLAAGASATFTFVVDTDASLAGGATITNTTIVATTSADANASNDTDTDVTNVIAEADLSVVKSESPDPVVAGANLTYSITVSNAGASDAQTVQLNDVIPAGTTFVSLQQTSGPAFTLTTPAVGGTGTATADIATLAAGATATFTLIVNVGANVAAGGTIDNTAIVASATADANLANNSDTEATAVITQADLSVAKTDSPDPVAPGANLTYTILVSNSGDSDAQNVVLTDAVAAGTTFVSLTSPAGWTSTTPAVGGTGTITSAISTLAAGATATFTLVVQVDAAATGTISNTATIAADTADSDANNNSVTATTTVQALTGNEVDLSVTKTDSPDAVVAGSNLTYTIAVENTSTNDATDVVLTEQIPAGTTFVSLTAPAGWTTVTPAVGGSGTITASIATLAVGASASFTLVVNLNASVLAGATISNTAAVATASVDVNAANDTDTETTQVNAQADLSVTKTDAVDPVAVGSDIIYTITVTNAGPSDAQSVSLSELTPAGTTFVSAVQTSGPAFTLATPSVGGTGLVTATTGTLAAGATATFQVVANVNTDVPPGALIINAADVVSVTTDVNGANNTDVETTTALAVGTDLEVTKSDSPATVIAGNNVTYTITVRNLGIDAAQNVVLTDVIPTETTFVSLASPAGWTSTTPAVGGTGTITSTIPTLAAGAGATFTVVVRAAASVLAGTTLTNTAAATTTSAEANTANNTDTETTQVTAQANLAVTKTGTPDPVTAGDDITYTITVTNLGPSDSQNVLLSDVIPLDTTFVSAIQTTGPAFTLITPAVGGTGTASATIGTLAAGASATFTLIVAVDAGAAGALIGNTASVSAATTDVNLTNNSASISVFVEQSPELELIPGTARLVDDPENPGQTMLLVVGTSGNDHILIEPRPSNRLQVRVKNTGKLMGIFQSSLIGRIVAFGLEGHDTIVVDHRLAIQAELHGNEGNDNLVGGKSHDLLFGEEGNDTLVGGKGNDSLFGDVGNDKLFGGHGRDLLFGDAGNDSLFGDAGNDVMLGGEGSDNLFGANGRDLLIGGEGRDRLLGQSDDDILIGGTTAFDADEAALLDILIQWSASASFAARISNLEAILNDTTVFDDAVVDELNGASGRDWYLDFALADNRVGFVANARTGDRRN